MNISESSIRSSTPTVRSIGVANDPNHLQAAPRIAGQVGASFERYKQARENSQSMLLNHNPHDPLSPALETASEQEKVALMVFESAVKNYGHELPEDALAFCNAVIESASSEESEDLFSTNTTGKNKPGDEMKGSASSAESEDMFSINTTGKNELSAEMKAIQREQKRDRIVWLALLKLNDLQKMVEALRTGISKYATHYKEDDGSGEVVEFDKLFELIEAIYLHFEGMEGLPGKGVVNDDFNSQQDAEEWAKETGGPLTKAELVDGKWVVKFNLEIINSIETLCIDTADKQANNKNGHKGEFLYDKEYAAFNTAISGIFGGWDNGVSANSQLASQSRQSYLTFCTMMSTLKSTDSDANMSIIRNM